MAAAVARLERRTVGQARRTVTLGGQSAGQITSGEAGQGQHGEENHEKRRKAHQILNRSLGRVGQQGLHGVFHIILHVCCPIVLILGTLCKELFKNIRERTVTCAGMTRLAD